jgi:streptogramin lyase
MMAMARSNRLRCGSGQRRSQPFVEGLESRRLMAVTYSFYPIASGIQPSSLTVGPDKNLWFTLDFSNGIVTGSPQVPSIGVINPTTGAITEYPTPTNGDGPASIVSGPSGDLWFIDGLNLASINPGTHAITEYSIPISGVLPEAIAVGSDGNLWFTDVGNSSIDMFNPIAHTATAFPLPNIGDRPGPLAAGPDGNLWFGLSLANSAQGIGDISPTTHAITLTQLTTAGLTVSGITAGPDGNVWFNETGGIPPGPYSIRIASINPTTHDISEFSGGGLGSITNGPDGNLWYNDGLGEFNPTTHVNITYRPPDLDSTPVGGSTIVTGPDNNVWFATTGYLVKATIIPATQSAIAGYVALDPNGSGNFAGSLDNVTVFLDLKGDGQLDPGDPIAKTDSGGYYTFTGLAPGTYTVRVVPYPGNFATSPNNSTQTVTVTGGQLGSPAQLGLLPTTSLQPLSYNPAPFGTHNPDVQTAEVNGLYKLILGRTPDATGGASAVSYLKNGGSVGQLTNDLLTSPEYETGVVASYYQNYLRRTGSTAEVAAWVAQMQQGETEEQVAAAFLDSAEYSALFPANSTFVQALYGDLLGRLPAASEIGGGVNLLNSGVTRPQLVSAFISTPESDIRGVVGLYGIVFARAAQSNEQTAGVSALQSGITLVQLATGMFGSAEFTARANATVG